MNYSDLNELLKGEDSSEIMILIEETLGLSKTQLMIYPQNEIRSEQEELIRHRISELKSLRPLQYILGKWEFWGRSFCVGEGVLIPREDTRAVIELAGEMLKAKGQKVFADLGSGSGIIAVTLACEYNMSGYAVECSEQAFPFLEKNLKMTDGKVQALLSDMFSKQMIDAIGSLDLVVSNPPYIDSEEMLTLDQNVLKEPHSALFGGEDGLDYYRKIARLYRDKLKLGGVIAFEVGYRQADAVLSILEKEGYHSFREKKDINGIRRAVGAIK